MPTKPSPHDLRAVVGTMELVEKYDKPVVFVINAAVMRARLTVQAAVALSQYGTVAPVTVPTKNGCSGRLRRGYACRL